MSPRVSLALPVYNGANFVAQAIQSIIDQNFDDFELLITDNASTDKTEDICRAFAARDKRIRYVRNERNLGAAANYNRGFELTSGEYFKWCAHDDFISSNFLIEGVRALKNDPLAVIAYGELRYVDTNGNTIPNVGNSPPDVSVRERTFPDMRGMTPSQRFQMLVQVRGSDNAVFGIMRRAALSKTSLLRKYFGSDLALLTEMAIRGPFVSVPDIVLYNRDHPSRSTKIDDKSARGAWINPAVRNNLSFEHLNLLLHQMEIAYRYRDVAPLHETLPNLLLWAMHPHRVGGYALELIGVLSPSLRRAMRKIFWRTVSAFRGPSKAVSDR